MGSQAGAPGHSWAGWHAHPARESKMKNCDDSLSSSFSIGSRSRGLRHFVLSYLTAA